MAMFVPRRRAGSEWESDEVMEVAEKGPPVILSWGEKTGGLKVGTRDSEYRGGSFKTASRIQYGLYVSIL
jgi:hypothetical protein